MKVFEANITHQVSVFLNENLKNIIAFKMANEKLFKVCGIKQFFENNEELENLKEIICETHGVVAEPDRAEYGDFQTNAALAAKVTDHLISKNINPKIIIEPTCGKGNFIIASLKSFKKADYIFGIEIHKPYVWETKFRILHFFIENPTNNIPEISIVHCNVFEYNFKQIAKQYPAKEILIIGNPPWITNSKLGSLNSSNLPQKTNFKNHSGIDSMTGKGNFDIAEYILLTLIETFQNMNGHLLLLVKNSVIKNILFEQKRNLYRIADIEKQSIDSKKEFNVSVEASLLYCQLNSIPEFSCKEFNFYTDQSYYQEFGWVNDKFVSNIDTYVHSENIDGESPFVWRQGLKHDCSAVMELDKVNGHYINGLNEEVKIEEELVYGLLKSSDLKNTVINQTRKYTIVTQKKVGQETKYIQLQYSKTYQYLASHQANFNARKSSIYVNKPSFSIFGIGDYSFRPYKVAISGLYKTFHFTLVVPQNNKPVMLDDTCYFIGFDQIEFAVYALILLNSEAAMGFLRSITFSDAKRTFTKDVLMRIDLLALAKMINHKQLQVELTKINGLYDMAVTLGLWADFIKAASPAVTRQIGIFA